MCHSLLFILLHLPFLLQQLVFFNKSHSIFYHIRTLAYMVSLSLLYISHSLFHLSLPLVLLTPHPDYLSFTSTMPDNSKSISFLFSLFICLSFFAGYIYLLLKNNWCCMCHKNDIHCIIKVKLVLYPSTCKGHVRRGIYVLSLAVML